jgi:hypothetical protein
MEGSVLSFLKAEWKVSNTGSAHFLSRSSGKKLPKLPYNLDEWINTTSKTA